MNGIQEKDLEKQRVDRFVLRFEPSYRRLAYYAALPLVLTPDLLNYLRCHFLRGQESQVPWVAEADLLLSDLCKPVGYEQYAMDASVRAVLLEEMERELGKPEIEKVARLLVSYIQQFSKNNPYLSDRELQTQQLAAIVFLDDDQVASEIANSFRAAVDPSATGDKNGNAVDRAEMLRLSRVTDLLAPQLRAHPELVRYAELVRKVLTTPELVPAAEWHRVRRVAGIELPKPVELISTAAPSVVESTAVQLLGFEFDIAEIVFEEELPKLKLELESFKYQIGTIAVIKSSNLFTETRFLEQEGQGIQFVEVWDRNVQLEMISIPPGSFIMGAPKEEIGSSDRERPQHNVNVERFFLGKYAITQAQYGAVMGNNPSRFKDEPDSPNHPVEKVSWDDATEFCQRISKQTGKKYRLPSEAEWEYACRGMTSPSAPLLKGEGSKKIYPPFHFGETIDSSVANYDARYTYGRGQKGEYRAKTTPVGSFNVANAFGLYDMHGNVWERCEDTWHSNYKGAPTDGSAWVDELNKTSHSLRGGSWDYNPHYCRSACRYNNNTDGRYDLIGFRVACSARGLL
jgi:formylglycine-generating enzyme required for sulfatase activity